MSHSVLSNVAIFFLCPLQFQAIQDRAAADLKKAKHKEAKKRKLDTMANTASGNQSSPDPGDEDKPEEQVKPKAKEAKKATDKSQREHMGARPKSRRSEL